MWRKNMTDDNTGSAPRQGSRYACNSYPFSLFLDFHLVAIFYMPVDATKSVRELEKHVTVVERSSPFRSM